MAVARQDAEREGLDVQAGDGRGVTGLPVATSVQAQLRPGNKPTLSN